MIGSSKNIMGMQFFRDWYVNASPNEKISMMSTMMQKSIDLEKRNLLESVYHAHLFNGHVDEIAEEFSRDYIAKNYE